MTTIKSNTESLEKQTGVESSLTDAEIQNHLEVVTKEHGHLHVVAIAIRKP